LNSTTKVSRSLQYFFPQPRLQKCFVSGNDDFNASRIPIQCSRLWCVVNAMGASVRSIKTIEVLESCDKRSSRRLLKARTASYKCDRFAQDSGNTIDSDASHNATTSECTNKQHANTSGLAYVIVSDAGYPTQ
jgi:hypothetical protein